MKLDDHWPEIRKHFKRSVYSNLHHSIAFVDAEGNPMVTPIGTLFLNKDHNGFYFEKFTTNLAKVADQSNPKICALAVNSKLMFWIKSLHKGKFYLPPALKLYGSLGVKRKATPEELEMLHKQTRIFKYLKGYKSIWADMDTVREIQFTHFDKINTGSMSSGLFD